MEIGEEALKNDKNRRPTCRSGREEPLSLVVIGKTSLYWKSCRDGSGYSGDSTSFFPLKYI